MDIEGAAAPPRLNGELVFDELWQGRAFGLAAALVKTEYAGDREPFRRLLIAAIAEEPERPYWHSWAVALERLVLQSGFLSVEEIDVAANSATPFDFGA